MTTVSDTEARFARIEETLYFQEEKLKDLERHILAQQASLDSLERQNTALTRALEQIIHQADVNFSGDCLAQTDLAGVDNNLDGQTR